MEGVTICCFADMYRKYSAKSSPVGKVGNTDLGKVPDTAWKAPDTAFQVPDTAFQVDDTDSVNVGNKVGLYQTCIKTCYPPISVAY